jgi:DNA-binding beta-propeller fold protein YncE
VAVDPTGKFAYVANAWLPALIICEKLGFGGIVKPGTVDWLFTTAFATAIVAISHLYGLILVFLVRC